VGAFVVYDVTDERSLEHSLQWKAEVDNVVRLVNDDPIPVVLLANKVILFNTYIETSVIETLFRWTKENMMESNLARIMALQAILRPQLKQDKESKKLCTSW